MHKVGTFFLATMVLKRSKSLLEACNKKITDSVRTVAWLVLGLVGTQTLGSVLQHTLALRAACFLPQPVAAHLPYTGNILIIPIGPQEHLCPMLTAHGITTRYMSATSIYSCGLPLVWCLYMCSITWDTTSTSNSVHAFSTEPLRAPSKCSTHDSSRGKQGHSCAH